MEIINLINSVEIKFSKVTENKALCNTELLELKKISEKNKAIYIDLFKYINKNESFLGIDSLNFQNKFLDFQIENNSKLYNIVINRIYGNYYKIHKNVIIFFKSLTHSSLYSFYC